MTGSWMKLAIFNFFLAASIGAILRLAFVTELSWVQFTNWMHGHSHVAMLGWVYMALFVLLCRAFVKIKKSTSAYSWNFGLTQVSVLGMLISFPLIGYKGASVIFSAMHIGLSYWFAFLLWRDIHRTEEKLSNKWDSRFLKLALIFMVLSTTAIWAMIPIVKMGHAGSALYHAIVQFYLHFQLNGWFIFALLALLFNFIRSKNIQIPDELIRPFLILLTLSTLFTYTLAVTWSTPLPWLFAINSLGVVLQFLALVYFVRIINIIRKPLLTHLDIWSSRLLTFSIACFVLKILAQTMVVLPFLATIAYTIRNYVIGFLHLLLLGMATTFLLGLANYFKMIDFKSPMGKLGISLLLAGLVLSELILFFQGTMLWAALGFIPNYYLILFIVSVLIPIGIGFILLANLVANKKIGQ